MHNNSCIIIAASFALVASIQAQVVLNGALAYSSTTDGGLAGYPGGQQVWNTGTFSDPAGDYAANLWFSDGGFGGAVINGPTDSDVPISFTLTPGTHTFYTHASSVPAFSHYGLNLFFGGDLTNPKISVFAALNPSDTDPIPAFAAVDSSVPSLRHDGFTFVPSSGTLMFDDGTYQVKLTEFTWFDTVVAASDRVAFFDVVPDGSLDFTSRFALEVTPVPEPADFGAVAGVMALAAVIVQRWRRA
jgi:hypothetical protein